MEAELDPKAHSFRHYISATRTYLETSSVVVEKTNIALNKASSKSCGCGES